jgi:hypothetical protein
VHPFQVRQVRECTGGSTALRTVGNRVLIVMLVFFSIGVTSVQATGIASPKTRASTLPSAPTILSVSATERLVGAVTLTVSFSPGRTSRKNPVVETVVFADKLRCIAKRTARVCRIRTKAGSSHVLRARSRTKGGFGEWSEAIQFEAIAGNWWKGGKSAGAGSSSPKSVGTTVPKGDTEVSTTSVPITTVPKSGTEASTTSMPTTTVSMSPTTTLPPARVDTSRAKVLTTSTAKLEKIAGLSKTSVAAQGLRSHSISKYAVGDVVFKSVGVVALGQLPEANRYGSRLLAVSSSGELTDALITGNAIIEEFFVAPNGRTFVLFANKVSLTVGGPMCLLAELTLETGVPRCVDPSLDRIKWNFSSIEKIHNQPLQFDAAGNLYFVGYTTDGNFLRRVSSDSVTDVLNGNIEVFDFVAMSDGDVLVSGQTTSSRVSWIRRYPATGGLVNLSVGESWSSLSRFVDGNVYLGKQEFVQRYLASSKNFEEKRWLSKERGQGALNTYFDGTLWCDDKGASYSRTLCDAGLGTWERPFGVLDQKNYVVLYSPRILMQYYPIVERANSVVTDVTNSLAVTTNIVLAGTNSAKKQVMTIYNTSSKQETIVLDGTNEIEIYSMSYVPRTNSVMFSGLRFSDNKFVIGEVSLG